MKYNKPEVVKLDSALNSIQGVDKPPQNFLDGDGSGHRNATIGAYEADE